MVSKRHSTIGFFITILIAILLLGFLYYRSPLLENFAYRKNPCKGPRDCKSCASKAGCGWCSDLKQCQPMAQDGFPIRTADSSTEEDVRNSPYLEEKRTMYQLKTTSKASRIHICNPFTFISDDQKC
jgi:hypothetical protein